MERTQFYSLRESFFKTIFSNTSGYVVLATMDVDMNNFQEEFFRWPEQQAEYLTRIDQYGNDLNVYYCPQVFSEPRRMKKTVKHTPCAWADLDACHPDEIALSTSFAFETSPSSYQAVWLFDRRVEPELAENISRRIANKHKADGADHCWNLGRLLRVPYTYNHKYVPPVRVLIVPNSSSARYREEDFDIFPQVQGTEYMDIPFPEEMPNATPTQILAEFKHRLPMKVTDLFEKVPEEGSSWSHPLWQLLMLCFEGGMAREQVYIVADAAACNKYRRDGKAPENLWADVCRSFMKNEFNLKIARPMVQKDPPLITEEELASIADRETWLERYIKWASGLGDAAKQYHQAAGFVCLSAVLSGAVGLPTSFGMMKTNLWFMILADTTLTRKTTAMDIGMDLLDEVVSDALLATDGSIEGVLTALSTRPGKPSIFLRDEFSGLLEQMMKRDYMAGFPELLTKLYDGKTQKRLLRKETIEVKDPNLILFTGGIKTKTQQILTLEQVASGFLPRFIFITAESDVSKMQPLGPPTTRNWGARSAIVSELQDIAARYQGLQTEVINGRVITTPNKRVWSAELTPAAWTRYNELESAMMLSGVRSNAPEVFTPVNDRLAKSILKAAVLLAASSQEGDDGITVDLPELLHAIKYGDKWRGYAKEIIANVGHDKEEQRMQTVYGAILRAGGITRSALMQSYHLSARDANTLFETLEQRGLITRVRSGRTEMLTPVMPEKGEKTSV